MLLFFVVFVVVCLEIRMLSKTCVKWSLLLKPKLVFKTNYRLMQIKSIAECSFTKLSFVIKTFVCLFLSDCFTQVLVYCTFSTYWGHLNSLPLLTNLNFKQKWRWVQWEKRSHFAHLTKLTITYSLLASIFQYTIVWINLSIQINNCPFYWDFLWIPCDFLYEWNLSNTDDNSSWRKLIKYPREG